MCGMIFLGVVFSSLSYELYWSLDENTSAGQCGPILQSECEFKKENVFEMI